jgi:Flp pilus assembly protein TadD
MTKSSSLLPHSSGQGAHLFAVMIGILFLHTGCLTTTRTSTQSTEVEPIAKHSLRLTELIRKAQTEDLEDSEQYEAFLAAERLSSSQNFAAAAILYQAVYEQSPNLVVGLKLARALTLIGKNAAAENVVRKIRLLFPKEPQPKLAEAYLAQLRGATDESLEILRRAYADHRRSEEVSARLVEALLAFEKKKEAEDVLKAAIADIPESPYFLLKLARIRFQEQNYTEAKTLLDNLLRVDPDSIEGWTLAGFIALEEGNDEDAEKYFRSAYEKQPENDALAKHYVSQLLKSGRLQEARRLLMRIEQSESKETPVDPDLKFQLAVVLFQLEEFGEAKERFIALSKTASDPGRMLYFAAQCDESRKKYQDAISLYQQVPPESEFRSPAMQRQIFSYLDSGNPEQARQLLKTFEETTTEENTHRFKAAVLARLKEYSQALALLRSVPEDERNKPEVRYLEAIYLEFVDGKRQSIDALKKLTKDFPDFSPALNHLGYTLVELDEELDLAKELLKHAVKLEPKNGFYLDSLGWAHFKKNELDEAERHLLEALQLEPGEPVILEHLGEVKLKQGDLAMALRYFERAMTLFQEAPTWRVESDEEWKASRKRVQQRVTELSDMAFPKTQTTQPAQEGSRS